MRREEGRERGGKRERREEGRGRGGKGQKREGGGRKYSNILSLYFR